MKVRDLGQAATKFATNGAAGANNYKSGVQSNSNWATNTEAAASTWQAGVTAAGAAARFSSKVAKAGQSKWANNAAGKGQNRFISAMQDPNTKANWQTAFGPYAQAISAIQQSPKGVRGSPGNYAIVQKIGDTLHALKVGS